METNDKALMQLVRDVIASKSASEVDAMSWEEEEKGPCPHTMDPPPQVSYLYLYLSIYMCINFPWHCCHTTSYYFFRSGPKL